MHAEVGDIIVVRAHEDGVADQRGAILDVRGANGEPPFIVRWLETGEKVFFQPGLDADVIHLERARPSERRPGGLDGPSEGAPDVRRVGRRTRPPEPVDSCRAC